MKSGSPSHLIIPSIDVVEPINKIIIILRVALIDWNRYTFFLN